MPRVFLLSRQYISIPTEKRACNCYCCYVPSKIQTKDKNSNKSSMEHIPRAQPRSCIHAAREYIAFYGLSMNMFVLLVRLYLIHTQGIYTFNFAEREKGNVGSAVVVILQPLCVFYCLFVTLSTSMQLLNFCSCHHS